MFDSDQDLWIGTNKGLVCLDYRAWDKTGFPGLRFWDQSEGYAAAGSRDACWDKEGNLWTGQEEGLVKVNVRGLKATEKRKLKVVLTELEIRGVFTRSDSLKAYIFSGFEKGDTLNEIRLDPEDRDLNFYFDVYNFINPEKDLFRYILEGYDHSWSDWKQNRRVRYTNLPPGEYLLRIESKNISSGAMALSHSIRFRILSPWYTSWQFVTIVFVLLVMLIWLMIQWRVRIANAKVRRSVETKQRMIELELRTLQNQINPHFMFNSLNSLQNFILDNKADDALEFLGDFANLLRKTFEFSTRKQVILAEYITLLEGYLKLEKLRFGEKIAYQVRVHENLDPQSILVLPLVLQPFVENAVKHGLHHKAGLGHIDIYIHRPEDSILECIVEDNGIGREASAKLRKFTNKDNNSLGIAITSERINLLNQDPARQVYGVNIIDLKEEDGSAAGTRVVIRLPYWPL
jgi:sensor histidine kinase YesM